MANTKSAIKQMRVAERRRVYNRAIRTRTRTYIKKARQAIVAAPEASATEEALRQAIGALDRAVIKGVIHRNNAARRKSRLMHQLQKLRATSAA